ncbi:asparagine synthase (glutamine-hydrolyzing) [Fodinibacter luteus]|uniref:asparagine synthase (glutamine-hydrolyzing) n=1 Tax=Fodinibacter luteus TaxID=552064 RepID=A0ABP8KJ50_9MICO
MCGLVGLLAPVGRDLGDDLDALSAAVAHRGPDDHGRWLDEGAGVALGHRRLSIVDLSAAGHQPMTSADGRWVLVLNGEIYDHAHHRRRLQGEGVAFRGHSDTEVLLELIARTGPEAAVAAVDGMFALAAWDRRDRVLVLARDRLGEKPLYYGRVGDAFAVASELGAIRRLPQVGTTPDPQALAEYLRHGFVPAPLSILPGIRKLPAGCTVRVTGPTSVPEPVPYWSLAGVAASGLADPLELDDRELVRLADTALRESVHRRLEADVPVGTFLSGGVDSSTIVALAQAVSTQPVRTFTVAVGGEGDESVAAAAVARHLGTEHTTLPLADLDPLDLASRAARLYDEPFADPSGVPTALLCAAARQHVTVCLSGDGADELLGGYNRYKVAQGGLSRLLTLPGPVRRGAAHALTTTSPAGWDRLARAVPGRTPAVGTKAHKLAGVLAADDPMGAYAVLATQWDPATLMTDPPPPSAPPSAPPEAGLVGATPLARMMLADQQRTLPDDMLVKVDRASMAVALEVRVPFLDHRFVELTWRMPERAKVRDGQGKWLVRQVLGQYVPPELWDRPKVGFDPPLADWLRGPLRQWSHDLLAPDRLRRQGLLRPEPITRALAEHDSGQRNHDYALWTVLMLQAWLDGTTS